jgi:putative aminopeptidase FrvX
MNKEKFLQDYLNAYSPVGHEFEGQKVWVSYLMQFVDEIKVDAYGTAYGIIKGKGNSLKVVLEAHCDEISWIITEIEKDGFIRIKRNGGSDNMIAPSKTVLIHTADGQKHRGVFGFPAVHVRKEYTEKGLEPHELWIDLGVDSGDKVKEMGIEVGNVVTFDDQFSIVGEYYTGRSLDNKIGGYIIAEVAKAIKNSDKLPFDLYIVNSVQEEVGLYGARLIAQTIRPDIALVHDVIHNTNTPKMDKSKHCDLKGGSGPVIEYSSQNHKEIIKKFRKVAEEKSIPLQLAVGSYGNDTVSFFLENIPTAILATPLKYMHTTVEMAHKDDVENVIKLFTETICSIDPEWVKGVNDPTSKYL